MMRCSLLFCLAVVLTCSLCAAAPPATAPTTAPAGVDPRADQYLRKMGETLAGAKRFSFRAHDMTDQTLEDGEKVQISRTLDINVRRPDGVYADIIGDEMDLHFVYDGKRVLLVNRRTKTFALHDAPPNNIDAMFDFIASRFGLTAPLSDLMFADPYATLIERARQGTYLGEHRAGDANCHHLAFRQEGLDWQIWIEDSPAGAVPRKLVITYKEQPGHPEFIALLDDWNFSPKADDAGYSTNPPAGMARKDLTPIDNAEPEATTTPSLRPPSNP
jgi:hypothetical protein